MYDEAVRVVVEVTGIKEEELFKSLNEECVDARSILIMLLIGYGYNERMISEYTGMSQQRINSLKNSFVCRKRKMRVEVCLQEINKKLTTSLQTIV